MTTEAEKLKAQEAERLGVKPPEEVAKPPEEVAKPPEVKGEEEITPTNAVQMAKTYQGMLKKTQEELASMTKEKADYQGLGLKIDNIGSLVEQHGQTLDLVTEILSTSVEANEELQGRVKTAQAEREKRAKTYGESAATMAQITKYAQAAGMTLEDEVLKSAKEAYQAGKNKEAIDLTVIACIGKKVEPPPAEPPPGGKEPAKNLKVIVKPPAPGKSTEEMSSREKILTGMAEAKAKQE